MAQFEILMPKMGESIEEATITKWFVKEGDSVQEDDVLLEIATDKVDSEIPSPVAGVVKKVLYSQDDTVAVGSVIAVIDLEGSAEENSEKTASPAKTAPPEEKPLPSGTGTATSEKSEVKSSGGRFYSPLVKKIAEEENIPQNELDNIPGSGLNGRVQKTDILNYLQQRTGKQSAPAPDMAQKAPAAAPQHQLASAPVIPSAGDEVIEMTRMRKLIASHMIRSKQTSAHVTNMIETDVTNVVRWREKIKDDFQKKEGVKITYLPVFLEATVKALRDFPWINASVDGDRIILKKRINLGVAVSLPDNNLIVPNIKDADTLNLTGLTKKLASLAAAARSNKLSPDDIAGGTFTVTNFGTFQNDIGTPIINQPEVAILAVGAVKKKPAVIETPDGDMIAIRHKMWLSLTYDHRIIDGALGGAFLKRLSDYIESFSPDTII
ncbi:MAG: dihydrolipoamide acetyltransferase family protein [Bacteroidota bacterium]